MRSTKSALHQISEKESLRQAWKAISRRNLRSKGLDNVTIAAFKNKLEENLAQISAELRAKSYVFNKLRAHAIDKRGSSKKRPLQIAAVRDRVVMKAVAMFISPMFARFNLPCSFAYVIGGGVAPVVGRIHELIGQGHKTYLEADIIDFFGSVDRDLLWNQFSKHVRHKSLLPLIRQCFDLELGNLDDLTTEDQKLFVGADSGIPQGGVLSPMLANYYLFEFDRKMLKNGFNLVRYADDFVVMCESKERAELAHDLCKTTLKTLKLEIHPLGSPKTRIGEFSKDGLSFLGLHFQGKVVFPAEKIRDRFRIKIKEALKPHSGLSLFKTLQKLSNLIHGWGNYFRAMHVVEIYVALDKFIKASVAAYLKESGIVLLGKDKRKQMKLLGIPSLSAMIEHRKNASPTTVVASIASPKQIGGVESSGSTGAAPAKVPSGLIA
jgi:RNA-directed DNA polymerase